jgi:hypothetical protein
VATFVVEVVVVGTRVVVVEVAVEVFEVVVLLEEAAAVVVVVVAPELCKHCVLKVKNVFEKENLIFYPSAYL